MLKIVNKVAIFKTRIRRMRTRIRQLLLICRTQRIWRIQQTRRIRRTRQIRRIRWIKWIRRIQRTRQICWIRILIGI